MAKVVVSGQIHPDGMAILNAEPGLEVELFTDPGTPVPMDSLASADALLIRYGVVTAEQVEKMPNLQVVSRHGVGCDNLPTAELAARGVPVTIVGPVNAVSVAEQVMAMMLVLAKQLVPGDAAVRGSDWNFRNHIVMSELAGKNLMLLGFGRIGREVARRARAFDMEVRVFDPFVSAEIVLDAGCLPIADWQANLPEVDVLSLHLPATPETRGMIAAPEFARMKPTAILINAARGGLIDEDALYAALGGPMAQGGAGLDCLTSEPPAPDLPLFGLPNVVFSPHSAALSAEAVRRMGTVAAQNVVDGLNSRVNRELIFNRRALEEAGHAV
ncbi:hydroxyacid dehydrogenase [Ruegeria marina]|uniref:D-3-phosphoglycerate dehydrogenase n=1 Tax=Ruegeria marina TaxID=639004 RepID=A0A1G6I1Z4_9RHOB|nr:hydroxyacid dehydrogenase [Ruegeria marina]SDC00557.1 D-3-phosphoglycerate dehydrogenase [Ruegeria marina]